MEGSELDSGSSRQGAVRRFIRTLTPCKAFAIFVFLGIFSCVLYYFLNAEKGFEQLFFSSGNDLFMDFFNSVRDAAQFSGVYTERGVIYPPLANLLFLIFSRFLPESYLGTSFDDRHLWREIPGAYLLIFLYTLVLLTALYILLRENTRESGRRAIFFSLAAVFSFPVIFAVERGNIILLSAILVLVFVATYDSESRTQRELGLICLAAAFGLKLYPALFGWVLIADKRYREAARCVCYGVLFLLIPSFFFGGPVCIWYMVRNVLRFSDVGGAAGTVNFTTYTAWLLGVSPKLLSAVFYAWCLVCVGAWLASPFVFRGENRWKCLLTGAVLILTVPSLTSPYGATFLLIPLLLLTFVKKQISVWDRICAAWMMLPFIPLPNIGNDSVNMITTYLATGFLSVFLTGEIVLLLIRKKRGGTAAPADGQGEPLC